MAVSWHLLKDNFREVDGAHVRVDHRQGVLKRCIDEGASPADTGVENGYGEGTAITGDGVGCVLDADLCPQIGLDRRTERSWFF